MEYLKELAIWKFSNGDFQRREIEERLRPYF